jgi:hypothetical protein
VTDIFLLKVLESELQVFKKGAYRNSVYRIDSEKISVIAQQPTHISRILFVSYFGYNVYEHKISVVTYF